MVDCRNCEFGGRPSYEWPCNICTDSSAFKQKPKPTTNADRIRAMLDAELAELFGQSCDCDNACCFIYDKDVSCMNGCASAWLDWLQSPVEVEE